MRYVLRADASKLIGAGHVMRSSAIAEELIARGEEVIFVGQISSLQWVSDRIRSLGFSQIMEIPTNFKFDSGNDVLILDSYTIPTQDVFIQPQNWRSIVIIFDDLTPNYVSNLRVHPGLTLEWPRINGVKTLSGANFVLLRKSITRSDQLTSKEILRIIVVGGGSDPHGFVSAVAHQLKKLSSPFHAVLLTNTSLIEIMDSRFSTFPIGLKMDEIANEACIVFTTASTTSLEFIARGCTVAIGCATDNQESYYNNLSLLGAAAPVGKFLNGQWSLDTEMINAVVTSQVFRNSLKLKSEALIDLRGSQRVVDEIFKL